MSFKQCLLKAMKYISFFGKNDLFVENNRINKRHWTGPHMLSWLGAWTLHSYQLTYVNFSCRKSTAALLATAIDRSSPFIVLVSHGAKTID